MNNYRDSKINRCRPGYGASCSLCCGSHNYVIPQDEIEELFLARGQGLPARPSPHPEESHAEKLIMDAMQCSHVCMLSADNGLLSCLIYDAHDNEEEDIKKYFTGTCCNFYCPAWHNLTDRQVLFAARLMQDWYYYSLFINDIEAIHEICATYSEPEDVPFEELRRLKIELEQRFLEEDGK